MGFIVSNRATKKQIALLKKLHYDGTGKYAAEKLTISEAAKIIDELFEEERLFYREIGATEADIY